MAVTPKLGECIKQNMFQDITCNISNISKAEYWNRNITEHKFAHIHNLKSNDLISMQT